MSKVEICWHRLTKCDTGQMLNPLMYVFLFVTFAFSFGFVFADGGDSVMASPLYQQTLSAGDGYVSVWGIIGLAVVALHVVGLLWRGSKGLYLMLAASFGGFYMWLWAAVFYIQGGFWFQFSVASIPNLLFWSWYSWQWYRRFTHQGDTTFSAFV